MENGRYFTRKLMDWHSVANHRSLPWKEEKDPYKIWLSEIILQQTRTDQGLPYYLRFTEQYPDVQSLAAAPDEDVFRLWQGLGYYNRCRNLLATARYVAGELGGTFPNTYHELLQLKGVGAYTAAAIGSFAYGLPTAVLDGNVYRVLSRYFGMELPIDTSEGKKFFQALADELVDVTNSAGYNQAIMDLGAIVCKPLAPNCTDCPVRQKCQARGGNLTDMLPVKSRKITLRKRFFHYLIFTHRGSMWIRKRTGSDIWQNLFEPFLIEQEKGLDAQELRQERIYRGFFANLPIEPAGTSRQKLTHQLIEARFFKLELEDKNCVPVTGGQWVYFEDLNRYPFPKTLVSFLEKKLYF